jgi:hypothetical protein
MEISTQMNASRAVHSLGLRLQLNVVQNLSSMPNLTIVTRKIFCIKLVQHCDYILRF